MVAVLFAWTYGLALFALASEVETLWLRILGIVLGSWMVVAGAIAGWQRFRD